MTSIKLAAATLSSGRITLAPFQPEHRAPLAKLAASEPDLFKHMPFPVVRLGYEAWFDQLCADQAAGRSIPHAIFVDSEIVGQSCYLNIRARDAGVEIGSTWYRRSAQGGFVNPSAKLLLIGNAFDQGFERVELKTDALNAQSRAALLKLGAKFEGVHRRHMRRADGTLRDTAWYSIIRDEWPEVRDALTARIKAFD